MSIAHRSRGRIADPAKRQSIILAAKLAFFDHGYAAASIEAIAAAAGVSKVTVYSHFGDKRGLLTAAVEHECENIRAHLLFDEAAGSLHDRLLAFGRTLMAFLSRPEMVQFEQRIAAETEHDPALGNIFLDAGPRRGHRALADFIARERDRGALVLDDPMLAAEQYMAMCKGMADVERRFTGKVDAEAADRRVVAAVDLFMRGYAAKRD